MARQVRADGGRASSAGTAGSSAGSCLCWGRASSRSMLRGYRFTARRLATGSVETLALLGLCWALHRGACRIIHQREKRWERPRRALAIAISSAITLRSGSRARSAEKPTSSGEQDAIPETDRPEVLARRLRQLVSYFVMAVAGLGFAWIWDLDLAFLRFLASQEVWSVGRDGRHPRRPDPVGPLHLAGMPGLEVHEPALRRDPLSQDRR